MSSNMLHAPHRDQSCDETTKAILSQIVLNMHGGLVVNWYCLCGNFVYNRRFCPKCKLVRFSLEESPILDYWGLKVGSTKNGLPFNFPPNLFSTHLLISGQTGS